MTGQRGLNHSCLIVAEYDWSDNEPIDKWRLISSSHYLLGLWQGSGMAMIWNWQIIVSTVPPSPYQLSLSILIWLPMFHSVNHIGLAILEIPISPLLCIFQSSLDCGRITRKLSSGRTIWKTGYTDNFFWANLLLKSHLSISLACHKWSSIQKRRKTFVCWHCLKIFWQSASLRSKLKQVELTSKCEKEKIVFIFFESSSILLKLTVKIECVWVQISKKFFEKESIVHYIANRKINLSIRWSLRHPLDIYFSLKD